MLENISLPVISRYLIRCWLLLTWLSLLAGATAQAQAPIGTLDPAPFYHWQHPRPVGELLSDLHVFNDSAAIVITRTNYAIRTTDGGRSWRYQELGLVNGLEMGELITFVGDTLGWVAQRYTNAAGNRSGGRLKRTLNGGRTWVTCFDRAQAGIMDVQFVTRRHGFILYQLGGNFYFVRTTDGGQTWTAHNAATAFTLVPGFFGWGNDIHFSSPTEGWVAGGYTDPSAHANGCILHTTDGGATWRRQTPLGDSAVDYNQVAFAADGQHGWALAADRAYRTSDGGLTWLPSPTGNYWRYRLTATDAQHAAIGGTTTIDGGVTWLDSAYFQIATMRKMVVTPAGRGWGIGNEGSIFRATRFGLHWQSDSGLTLNRTAIQGFEFGGDARRGWARRYLRFPFHTTTRGRRWGAIDAQLAVPALWQMIGYQVADVGTVDFDTATALVAHRDNISTLNFYVDFLRTTDGGRTWQVQPLPGLVQYLTEIRFYNSRHGCAVGSGGQAVITHDGGQTWQQVNTGTTRQLQNIAWASPTRLSVSARDSALLLVSSDGGQTWQRAAWPAFRYTPVAWRTPVEGWIDGGERNLRSGLTEPFARSTNDFQTYAVVPNVTTTTLSVPALNASWQGLRFLDSTRAVIRDSRPMYSADRGITWQVVSERTTLPPIHGLIDRYNGWFGGAGYFGGGGADGILHYSERFLQADTSLRGTFCTGDSLALAFTRIGTFGATEQPVVAELSDAHGRFGKYPRVVGQGTASPLMVRLPAGLPAGSGYLLRVSRPDHSVLGGDNEHPLTIYPRPAAVAVLPLDSARICAGDSVQLAAPVGYGQYRWLDGDTTRTRWVRAAGSYAVAVALGGGCFGPTSRPVTVRITPRPAVPALTLVQTGSGPAQLAAVPVLAGATYAWTGPAGVVAGATGPTLLLTGAVQNGNYSVAVRQRGCASIASAVVNVTITGLPADEASGTALTLTPNPAADAVTVALALAGGGALRTLFLTDLAGRRLLALATPKAGPATVDLRAVPVGTYLLRAVAADGRTTTRRLVVAR